MSNYKERLKNNRGGAITYLDVAHKFTARADSHGPAFMYYKQGEGNEPGTIVYTNDPIEGIFLGAVMKLSIFDDNLGSKGGTYESSYYLTNDKIVLRDNRGKVVCKGSLDDMEAFVTNEKLTGTIKKRQAILVVNEEGMIAVLTNVTIAIDNLKKIKSDDTSEYLVRLTPKMFDPEDKSIGSGAKEILGKFAKKNKPCYAKIELTDQKITDEIADKFNLDHYLDNFDAWKELQKSKTAPVTEKEDIEQPPPHTEADIPPEEPKDDLPY